MEKYTFWIPSCQAFNTSFDSGVVYAKNREEAVRKAKASIEADLKVANEALEKVGMNIQFDYSGIEFGYAGKVSMIDILRWETDEADGERKDELEKILSHVENLVTIEKYTDSDSNLNNSVNFAIEMIVKTALPELGL